MTTPKINIDALAQEIRRVDGNNRLGAGSLADALLPFIERSMGSAEPVIESDTEILESLGQHHAAVTLAKKLGYVWNGNSAKWAAPPAPVSAEPVDKDRLLAALERAGAAETALRNLVDECNNDARPGWEERMEELIQNAEQVLSGVPPPTFGCVELPRKELESMIHMFNAACIDLGLINEALGLDPDDGGAEPILSAIEELKAKLSSLPADWDIDSSLETWFPLTAARLAELESASAPPPTDAKDGEDAARYRWLRDISVPPHNFYLSVPEEFKDEKYRPEEVDSAIDAAIAAKGE